MPAENLNPDYLVEVLATDVCRAQIEAGATGTSESMKNISQDVIRNLELPMPERARQDEIAALMRNAGALAERLAEESSTLRELTKAVREALLEGALEASGDAERAVRATDALVGREAA